MHVIRSVLMIMLSELFMNPSRKFKKVLLLGAAMFQVTYLAQLFGWLGYEFLLLVPDQASN
jgi:hypothetical protein